MNMEKKICLSFNFEELKQKGEDYLEIKINLAHDNTNDVFDENMVASNNITGDELNINNSNFDNFDNWNYNFDNWDSNFDN